MIEAVHSQNPAVRFFYNAALSYIAILTVFNTAQAQISEELDCVIYPSLVADLGSTATGTLSEIYVDRGDTINAGDELAVLESGAEKAAVQLARIRAASTSDLELQKNSIAFAERRQNRAQELVGPKLISDSQFDEYETETRIGHVRLKLANEEAEIAKIELLRAEALLARRSIRSPFDGVVLERYTNVGELVEEKPVIRVAKLNPLHVEVIVPASEFSQLEIGLQAQIRIADLDGITWSATVNRVDPVADVASDTYGVQLVLPNPEYSVPAGRRCLLRFLETKPSLELKADIEPIGSESEPTSKVASMHTSTPQLGAATQPTDSGLVKENEYPNEQHYLAESVETACRWAGPFRELEGAKKAQSGLNKYRFGANIVEHSAEQTRGVFVVSPLQSSRHDAQKLLEQLKSSGYVDAYLPSRMSERRVSLGAFEDTENAELLRRSLSARGIEVELSPWRQRVKQYYLAVHTKDHGNFNKAIDQIPLLKQTIPLRNSDGTFRDAVCDSYIVQ